MANNLFNDLCINCKSNKNMKDYLKTKGFLVDNNYELIGKNNLLKI